MEPSLPDLLIAGVPSDPGYVHRVEAAIRSAGLEERAKYLWCAGSERRSPRLALPRLMSVSFPSMCQNKLARAGRNSGTCGVMACSGIPPMNEVGGYAAEYFEPTGR